jgi:hypothetical protein
MSQALRWMLILGCLMLAVLEVPQSSALVVEDCAGPYSAPLAVETASVELAPQAPAVPPARGAESAAQLAQTVAR